MSFFTILRILPRSMRLIYVASVKIPIVSKFTVQDRWVSVGEAPPVLEKNNGAK